MVVSPRDRCLGRTAAGQVCIIPLLNTFPVPSDIGLGMMWAGHGVFYSITPAGFLFPELLLKHVPPAFSFCSLLWQAQLTTAWRDLALFVSWHLPASLDTHSFLYWQGRTSLRALWTSVISPLSPLFPQTIFLAYLTSPCLEVVLCFWLSLQSLPAMNIENHEVTCILISSSWKKSTLYFHGMREGSCLLMAAALFWWL